MDLLRHCSSYNSYSSIYLNNISLDSNLLNKYSLAEKNLLERFNLPVLAIKKGSVRTSSKFKES